MYIFQESCINLYLQEAWTRLQEISGGLNYLEPTSEARLQVEEIIERRVGFIPSSELVLLVVAVFALDLKLRECLSLCATIAALSILSYLAGSGRCKMGLNNLCIAVSMTAQ